MIIAFLFWITALSAIIKFRGGYNQNKKRITGSVAFFFGCCLVLTVYFFVSFPSHNGQLHSHLRG